MNISGNLATEERLAWIMARLEKEGRVRIGPTAEQLGVSEMTIRRALQELEAMGLARRLRGGAVALGPVPFADRHRTRARAKTEIASKIVPLIPSSGAIGVDASSTVYRVVTMLSGGRDLSVITNGPETFEALQGKRGIRAVLTGGQLDPRTGSLIGPIACRAARSLLLDKLVMSAAAIDPTLGASESCLEEAEVKKVLAEVAGEVILAVDSSKVDSRAVAVGMDWDQVTILVTELDPGDARLDGYRSLTKII